MWNALPQVAFISLLLQLRTNPSHPRPSSLSFQLSVFRLEYIVRQNWRLSLPNCWLRCTTKPLAACQLIKIAVLRLAAETYHSFWRFSFVPPYSLNLKLALHSWTSTNCFPFAFSICADPRAQMTTSPSSIEPGSMNRIAWESSPSILFGISQYLYLPNDTSYACISQ